MTVAQVKRSNLQVVGGVYRERCMRPGWVEIFGSGGRAASALATLGARTTLNSYLDDQSREILQARAALEDFEVAGPSIGKTVTFDYTHGLATPVIVAPEKKQKPIRVKAECVLRFGMIEADAIVSADRVVYDPQDAYAPESFQQNGSHARQLAVVLNQYEAGLLMGLTDEAPEKVGRRIVAASKAQVVIIKQGPRGALVFDGKKVDRVPAYLTERVWKIGSGDHFAAHFAFRWMHEGRSAVESADLASRATAYFVESRGFPTLESLEAERKEKKRKPIKPSKRFRNGYRPQVYLAGPFFTLAQLWMVEQARADLLAAGLNVFSPYHDVGHGSAEDVVQRDLDAIEKCDVLFAIGDGMDSGTVYEIGYARAKGKPVVMYCENETDEKQKMMEGSDCELRNDYVSAVYQTLWTACET